VDALHKSTFTLFYDSANNIVHVEIVESYIVLVLN